jgi:hypothetical protein
VLCFGGEQRLADLLGKAEVKRSLGDLGVDVRVVLTLKKQVVRACIGFIWLRVVKHGGLV